MDTLGQRIRHYRTARNLRGADVAAAVGISLSFYTYIENDRRDPPISVVLRIAGALDCKVVELTGPALGLPLPVRVPQEPTLQGKRVRIRPAPRLPPALRSLPATPSRIELIRRAAGRR